MTDSRPTCAPYPVPYNEHGHFLAVQGNRIIVHLRTPVRGRDCTFGVDIPHGRPPGLPADTLVLRPSMEYDCIFHFDRASYIKFCGRHGLDPAPLLYLWEEPTSP